MKVVNRIFVALFVGVLLTSGVVAQQRSSGGAFQRLEVLRSQLEQMKKSLESSTVVVTESDSLCNNGNQQDQSGYTK